LTFIDNPENLPHVNHKDENAVNNCVNNLEWCTAKYNLSYGNRIDKYRRSRGTKVLRFDLNDNYIDSWNSMCDAARSVYNNVRKETDIRRNCLGISSRVLNYKWRFSNDA
jgi:hypothetical protein